MVLNSLLFLTTCVVKWFNGVPQNVYRNDPKFLDRQVWANSADPDQTAPRGAV